MIKGLLRRKQLFNRIFDIRLLDNQNRLQWNKKGRTEMD